MNNKEVLRISQFCETYSIGRTKAYQEISLGRLRSYKVGRARMISSEAAKSWQKSYENRLGEKCL